MYFYKKKVFKNGVIQIGVYDENGKWIKWKEQGDPCIHFGKYKGIKLKELPKEYVEWLLEQPWIRNNLRDKLQSIS